jgi:hypothetical protein
MVKPPPVTPKKPSASAWVLPYAWMVPPTANGNPAISEFAVFNDPDGELFNDPTGTAALGVVGK